MKFTDKTDNVREQLWNLINENNDVVDWYEDMDDELYDYDMMLTFNVSDKTICEIWNMKCIIEEHIQNLNVHVIIEQIVDQINENEKTITIDFCCDKEKV